MNKSVLKKEMLKLVNEVKGHFDRFENEDIILQPEMDQLVSNVELLYKKTIVFEYLNNANESTNEESSPALPEIEISDIDLQAPLLQMKSEPTVEQETIVTEVQAEAHLPVAEATVIADLKEEAIAPPAENLQAIKQTVITEKEPERPQKAVLTDLKSQIGINDKFQFIAELFQNSGEKYEKAIRELNGLETIEASLSYLDDLRMSNGWKEDSEPAQRLTDIVKRRFL
jgi:hypothetical protein